VLNERERLLRVALVASMQYSNIAY